MYFLLLILIYIAFISLGLPDSVLGAAWPSMYRSFGVPEGSAGIITMLMYSGTMISSIASDWIIRKLGTGKVLVISVALTAITMLGFSMAGSFTMLCLIALPYGLGGGCVDASLNNYVATHYKARHMSFLHCFWGIGTIISPLIMGSFIENGGVWTQGYRAIAVFQFILVAVLIFSIPLWKKDANEASSNDKHLSLSELMGMPGVKASLAAFFCYCSMETTMGLWTSTYLSEVKGVDLVVATKCGMLFYIGIASGRFISGMISERLGDMKLIFIGTTMTVLSLSALLLPGIGSRMLFLLIILAGMGCGPIFPSMVHHSPEISGPDGSQMLIGFQLAVASAGSIMIPALFGIIVNRISIALLPFFCLIFTLTLAAMVLAINRRH
ncbi:MAG: MFS transporter [Bacteroidales bacterium]|nr:MFS transporter [Bacteroidales bacterium]